MKLIKLAVALAWAWALVTTVAWAQAAPDDTPAPAAYAALDPLEETTSDFLDLNLRGYSERALELYTAGDYRQAAQIYLYVLQFDIGNAGLIYSLACCYGQLGEPYLASLCLERAVRAGFEDLEQVALNRAFDPIRDDALFTFALDLLQAKVLEQRATLGEQRHFQALTLMPYRVQLPPEYDPAVSYPLLLGLHGYGSCADWFMRIWVGFENPQFIYAVPQAPYPILSEGEVRYSWLTGDEGSPESDLSRELSEAYLRELIDRLKTQFAIDGVFLLGFSQGGILSYDLGILYPDEFQGVICFGSFLDLERVTPGLSTAAGKVPVFIAHGLQDAMVKFERALEAREVLTTAGFDVTFYEFPGGHGLSVDVLRAAEAWLAERAGIPARDTTSSADQAAPEVELDA